ncbi:helix-turn-helix transcriptional regulator [Paenibacillus sp.]|uniref:helix-turn-helix domain-containing protein n=1 Tax=Paenibacillus sp. TaxID=58172 RepID=UPI002D5E5B23|nr:helix-turn-helix transcriptional regulator [Paenibacillus sp.]HZG84917.1 helix-turn-helix transcriptional regulator [Paenibacillus sp.]
MKTCGQRISELRESQKLTQGELSSRLGITRASLSHYETGRRVPDYETIKKIADFFRVSVDYLIGRTEDSEPTVNENVKIFEESLELSDETILERFTLTVDGRELTPEEAKRFIAFVRAERSIR